MKIYLKRFISRVARGSQFLFATYIEPGKLRKLLCSKINKLIKLSKMELRLYDLRNFHPIQISKYIIIRRFLVRKVCSVEKA